MKKVAIVFLACLILLSTYWIMHWQGVWTLTGRWVKVEGIIVFLLCLSASLIAFLGLVRQKKTIDN